MEARKQAKIALATGGGTGLGRAMSKALGAAGYTVVISGRRLDVLEKAAAELSAETGATYLAVAADVGDGASVRILFDKIEQHYGRLDLLVDNAGTTVPNVPIDELSVDQWNAIVAANLTGAFLCTQ